MRQASWNELFTPRPAEPVAEPRRRERLLSWEDVITFGIVLIVFQSVVGSIDSAHWVDDMPSLYPLALVALLLGLLLARSRAGELLAHSLSLLVGGAVCLATLLFFVSGDSPAARVDNLVDRMHAWFGAAFGGDISTDTLAFMVLLVVVTWLAAYASAWSIFRWHNAWLGLVPGGLALLINISYLPGQFSIAFVFFLFGAVLLVMRVHLLNSMRRWRASGVPYPEFLSLSSLHLTFWAALLLLAAAWAIPPAPESGALTGAWDRLTGPVSERVSESQPGIRRSAQQEAGQRAPVRVHPAFPGQDQPGREPRHAGAVGRGGLPPRPGVRGLHLDGLEDGRAQQRASRQAPGGGHPGGGPFARRPEKPGDRRGDGERGEERPLQPGGAPGGRRSLSARDRPVAHGRHRPAAGR